MRNNRILVIDDNPSIHKDIRKILCGTSELDNALSDTKAILFDEQPAASTQQTFEIDSAFQGQEGLAKVQQSQEENRPYALAFVDVRMPPGWDGVETVTRIWEKFPDLQIVICTAYSDYSWEQMIQQIGVSDNLVILKKPFDNIEVLQLAHALTQKWTLKHEIESRLRDLDRVVAEHTTELKKANEELKAEIAERRQMEKALRLSEERFSKAFKASPIPLAIQSLVQERYVDVNQGFQELTGFSRAELIGHTPSELCLWGNGRDGANILQRLREEMSVRDLPCRLHTRMKQVREIRLSVEVFELDGQPFLLNIAQDVSAQTKLEERLRQSQKMEAMGQMAAGVAHDFNNVLTVVQGYASLLLTTKPPECPDRKALQTITAAADRASKLVRQLLTFSHQQVMQLQPLRVQETLATLSEMLPRLVGEHIRIQVTAADGLPMIQADPAMMEQMLINLAVNARDAMAPGGLLTISASQSDIRPEQAHQNRDSRPGTFLCLRVSDTGCGIPPEVLPRIFEPFFTTKGVGKGTGLGLATVFGIVQQHRGWLDVQSLPGQGSTFSIYLPTLQRSAESRPTTQTPQSLVGGNETILVVEDEEDVRDFIGEVLKAHGYHVLLAGSGPEACKLWAQHRDRIDLMFTDMIMPGGLSGWQVADRLTAEKPSLKVIYTSGYSPGMGGKDLSYLEGQNFLPKPHGPARLLRMLRDCLDQKPGSPTDRNSPPLSRRPDEPLTMPRRIRPTPTPSTN